MNPLTIVHDRRGATLTVWFDEPEKEHATEETGRELNLIKDREGRVIGVERLNWSAPSPGPLDVELVER